MFFHYVRMCAALSVMHGGAVMVALFFLSDVHGWAGLNLFESRRSDSIRACVRLSIRPSDGPSVRNQLFFRRLVSCIRPCSRKRRICESRWIHKRCNHF